MKIETHKADKLGQSAWRDQAAAGDLEGALASYFRGGKEATFFEVQRDFSLIRGVPAFGTAKLVADDEGKILLWDGLSDELSCALTSLLGKGFISVKTTELNRYEKLGLSGGPAPVYDENSSSGDQAWLPVILVGERPDRFSCRTYSANFSQSVGQYAQANYRRSAFKSN